MHYDALWHHYSIIATVCHSIKMIWCTVQCLEWQADSLACGAAISCCGKALLWRPALKLLTDLCTSKAGVFSVDVGINDMIQKCLGVFRSFPVGTGVSWWAWLACCLLVQVEVKVSAFNAAITGCEKSRRWQTALELFIQIEDMNLQPPHGQNSVLLCIESAWIFSVPRKDWMTCLLSCLWGERRSQYIFLLIKIGLKNRLFYWKGAVLDHSSTLLGPSLWGFFQGTWSLTAPWSVPVRRVSSGKGHCVSPRHPSPGMHTKANRVVLTPVKLEASFLFLLGLMFAVWRLEGQASLTFVSGSS